MPTPQLATHPGETLTSSVSTVAYLHVSVCIMIIFAVYFDKLEKNVFATNEES